MTNILINIPILLEHRSQVVRDVFIGYHMTIKSNIPLVEVLHLGYRGSPVMAQ
jgi:hypothetical protein